MTDMIRLITRMVKNGELVDPNFLVAQEVEISPSPAPAQPRQEELLEQLRHLKVQTWERTAREPKDGADGDARRSLGSTSTS